MMVIKCGVVVWSFMHRSSMGLLPDARSYVAKAKEFGYDGIALDNAVLPSAEDIQANRELKKTADDLGMYIDVGTLPLFSLYELIKNKKADAIFERAKLLGSPYLKSILQPVGIRHNDKWEAPKVEQKIEQTIEYMGVVSETAKQYDIPLAFENHIDFRTDELIRMFNAVQSPYVGLMLDTANQMVFMEEPAELCSALLSRVLLVHFKDGYVVETEQGANIIWCVPGQGIIDTSRIAAMLSPLKDKVHFNLELIVNQQWPVPFNTAEYWHYLGITRNDDLEMMNRMKIDIAARRPVPPVDPEQLLMYEDEHLKRSVPAMRALFR